MTLVRLAVFLAAFVVLGLAPDGALAQSTKVFTVSEVRVDATEATATKAREVAMLRAQRQAFDRLVQRLTVADDRAALPEMGIQDIVDLVAGVSVDAEKSSSVRYIASLTVQFNPDAVRRLLRVSGVSFTEVVSKPVLVVPVYQRGATAPPALWEEDNPWRLAWLDRAQGDGLVPLIVPLGDLSDMTTLTADQGVRADGQSLRALAERYGAGDALVAHAILVSDDPPIVETYTTRTGSALQEQTSVRTFAGAEGDTVQGMLAQAMNGVVATIEENWKRDNQMRFGESGRITVLMPLSGFADLVKLRKILDEVPVVSAHALQAVKKDLAQATLDFVGDGQQLAVALEQKDLVVDRSGAVWTVRLPGTAPLGSDGGR